MADLFIKNMGYFLRVFTVLFEAVLPTRPVPIFFSSGRRRGHSIEGDFYYFQASGCPAAARRLCSGLGQRKRKWGTVAGGRRAAAIFRIWITWSCEADKARPFPSQTNEPFALEIADAAANLDDRRVPLSVREREDT